MDKGWIRLAGIAGIIFFLLVAVPSFLSGSPPDPSDPSSKFVTYYQDNRSALITASLLGTLGDIFAVVFIGGLIFALRRLGASLVLLVAALSAFILTGALATTGGIFQIATAFRVSAAQHVDAETIRLLADASAIAFTLIGVSVAALLAAMALMFARVRFFPMWLAWVAGVGAVLEVVGAFSVYGTTGAFSPEGFLGLIFGLLPFAVFVVATSIIMVMRGDAIESSTA